MRYRLTTEEFIRRAREKHGDKYSYSKVICNGYDCKVEIICPKHGSFWQIASNHIAGKGCVQCWHERKGLERRKTTKDFIKKANEVHNNFYDYSKTEYTRLIDKVIITCPLHGDFVQLASNHLKGEGCYFCGINKNNDACRSNTKEFIRKANIVHSFKYDYSKTNYKNNFTPVIISCSKHGDFKQSPSNHLKGESCPKCAMENKIKLLTGDKESFIKQAKLIHGNKYDYSLVEYKKSSTKVSIICNKHGVFEQTPNNHLRGEGCPKCKTSVGEERVKRFLESKKIKYIFQYKVNNDNIFSLNRFIIVDFYLPEYKMFIEYNGKQHYKPIDIFGGKNAFKKQTERDFALRQYCKEHKYKLIEIHYKDYNRIDTILTNNIKGKRKRTLP